MDRRHAIKNIGLTMGFVAATPTIMSLLQSCQNETIQWVPEFFSEDEGLVISRLVDTILPKTDDTPGASEVNVPQFIDLFAKEVMKPQEQELMKKAMNVFINKALTESGKTEPAKLKEKDLEPILASSLKISKEKEEAINKKLEAFVEASEAGTDASVDDDVLIFTFLNSIRGLSIWGYKTSEIIGEQVLAYEPVPGRQQGCVDLDEATGGKAWSL